MAKETKRKFVYEKRSVQDIKARANMRGGGFDSFIKPEFKRYKVKDGKNMVRIMPATWPKPRVHYGWDIWLNYGIGADNQSYLSLSKMGHEDAAKDPLVEARHEAQREGDEKTAKALAPRQRVLVWVIDRNEEDEGPQLWDIPFSVDKDFINLCRDEDSQSVSYPDDPEEGHDLRFYKEGTGVGTKYPASRMKLMDASPLHEDEAIQNDWMDYIQENPVPDCLQYYSAEHIGAAFNGAVRTIDDDDDDRPAKRKPRDDDEDEKPKRSARVREEPEDEEEPAPRKKRVVDDDEEPEEKPKRSARVREEPEEEETEEEVEEEKPRSSIRERLAAVRKKSSKSADEDED